MGNKVKVVGYATKQVFNGNIEYRNFSNDLVGNQSTGGDSLFTLGNFAITTTLDAKPSKIFTTNKFSNFNNLCNLNLTVEETDVFLNNAEVELKLDKTNLCNYAYFGSMLEYVRVSLESIITKWPASIYMNSIIDDNLTNLTVEDYIYDTIIDTSTFKVDTNVIRNQYQINFLKNGIVVDGFSNGNDMRNLSVNYLSYSVLNDNIEYAVLDFTGSTNLTDDYIYLTVKGNPFSGITGTTSTINYHIKPNKLKEETFYTELPDFEANLLNRLTTPKYTSVYKVPKRNEMGTIISTTNTLTWPVSDGYNIDFNSSEYISFAEDLINISTNFDENKTNLMVRFLTAEAISDFDTVQTCDGGIVETESQRMNKTLKIYGREYDEVKRYIDGIQYANTVTYNEVDNTPNAVLKYLAKTLGWGLVSSVLENDLLANYVTSSESTYSGMSRGYTAVEAEVEMWRRIILNTPWLWKSKGARKSVEFLFKFIGAPDGLINFNEFIYLAKDKIDVDLFKTLLEANNLDTDISLYNLDSDGYPRIKNNNPDMYFQKGGLWFRQTAGSGATIDITSGNNPHVGPYDGGAAFMNQFNCLIPNFSATTVSSTTVTTDSSNLFTNYESGTVNEYDGDYFVDVTSDGVDISDCVVVTTTKVPDPFPTASEISDCGCEVDEDDYALLINTTCSSEKLTIDCRGKLGGQVVIDPENGWFTFIYNTYDVEGNILPQTYTSIYASTECCRSYGGAPLFYEDFGDYSFPVGVTPKPTPLVNCGYVCCKTDSCGCSATCNWTIETSGKNLFLIPPHPNPFLVFVKPNGDKTNIVPTSCSCPINFTVPVTDVIDTFNSPNTGTGCMLTKNGLNDINNNNTYYYLSQDGDTLEWSIQLFFPTTNNPTPPTGATTSFLETLFLGMAGGQLPCDNQYMNVDGLEVNNDTYYDNNDTK